MEKDSLIRVPLLSPARLFSSPTTCADEYRSPRFTYLLRRVPTYLTMGMTTMKKRYRVDMVWLQPAMPQWIAGGGELGLGVETVLSIHVSAHGPSATHDDYEGRRPDCELT